MFPGTRTGDGSKYALNWRTGNKPLSLIYSLAFHKGLVAFAFLVPVLAGQPHEHQEWG